MRRFASIITGLALVGQCHALEPTLFGYFEPQLMGAYINDEVEFLNSNKLRLDLEAVPTKGVKFGANVNFLVYSGKTSYDIAQYLPEQISAEIPSGEEDSYTLTYEDSIALDNAYVRISSRFADLTVGKQQISYGTGYAWNPSDIFNLKDVLDPTYEQPGHNAMRLDLPLSRSTRIMAVYSPGEKWDVPTALLRLKATVGRFDLSISGISTEWARTVYPELTAEKGWRRLVGGDLVGQLLGLGLWAEYAYNTFEFEKDFWEGVAGFDYTFRNELYLLGEIFHNSSAKASSDDYTLTDWMRYFTGERRTLGKTQAYLYSQLPLTELISAGGSVIGCISDESIALVPQLNYSLFQDVELTAFGNFFAGKAGGMYSKDLGNGGLVRLRVYF